MSAADPSQRAAARSFIEQLVANSDAHGDDAREEAHQSAAATHGFGPMQSQNKGDAVPEEVRAAAAARQAALQQRQEEQYHSLHGSASNASTGTDELQYRDEVVSAFENYGEITAPILSEWKEMFSLFDADNSGFLPTDELGTVLRGLGRNLTEERVALLINAYDATGAGKIDFQTFYTLMVENAPMPGPAHEAQVLRDFRVFDVYRDGLLPVVDLVHLLRNLGEPLTRDDVDHLLQEIYIDGDNKINIQDLVQHMFRTSAPNPE